MSVSLVNGTSAVTLLAPEPALVAQTADFYADFAGFSVEKKTAAAADLAAAAGPRMLIRVSDKAAPALVLADLRTKLAAEAATSDWRARGLHVTWAVASLNGVILALRAARQPVQIYPNDLYPVEAYLVDPLGHVVGFTGALNLLSFSPHVEKLQPPAPAAAEPMSTSVSESQGPVAPQQTRRNIAVMTSGGDAPGMNACVRAVVRAAIYRGCRAYAVMEGYEGLVRGGPEYIREMSWQAVEGYLSDGGTNIGTARCMAFKERAGRLKGCKHMIDAGIDALIVCGGDGSLTGADLFRAEWPSLIAELRENGSISADQYQKHKHLNICGTVGSIDNDMATTDATIGAYSSLDRICKAIDYIDATANSHSRAFVVEVMGRHCGWLALMAGIACSADYILIPEKPSSSKDWQDQMCNIVSKHRAKGRRKTVVVVAEGAISSDLEHISADDVKDVLVDMLGLDTRVTTLGHVQRGGKAVTFDRGLATLQGVEAVKAVLESTPETPSPLIGLKENKVVRLSLVDAVRITKSVAEAIESKNFDKAMELRDTDFGEYLKNFMAVNSANHERPSLPIEKRKRIAIINVGAPAGGMNSAIYSMATYCMSRGHTPYAIHNGFSGLARHESVHVIDWLNIENWMSKGGCEIGTNRTTPEETDFGMIAYYFEKYAFDGLVIVGGFEAFESLHQLERARAMYPCFRIPMVLVPATLSNNVPGTEYSLGADTCLNSLMDYCDIVKQSASATRNRAFVIEVQGGNSGYIATYAGLACGAQISYVPEEGIDLAQLECDIKSLTESFATNSGNSTKSGRLILKSINASKVLSTDVIANIMRLECDGAFDVKTALPGHVQQGGLPSPIDRTRACRFAVRAVQFIEDSSDNIAELRYAEEFRAEDKKVTDTAAVLGVKSSHLRFTSIRQLYDYETEIGKRMPKTISWQHTRDIADQLVGRTKLVRN
ncbi:6-phosphofructokinase [Metschnikowia bicuspidata var. bicuspidata NRRL YB-4993]|uniref:ATP-dependent 6-phosphofructokinase n=1 Tax=Metschnikowia bicuspidata var. bicuspidata NRRL YB-4993 TaxID=869754 RepID=A0A1A0HDM2_9ASCO|nr:6-phosphofructokinase [Metschnikowia bicuspidata var. bicuspidata NRRL YB-4993]OBA22075.1 6-phosphofructokinase [Metschnikowia bicuspidata var. bicuspidata NRRL YB-4993]